ncbi:MAG: phosphotransferase [Gammaproteobacteria bacterium]|nr:phosphotransferase [Gammaproteobacteria bacterium]
MDQRTLLLQNWLNTLLQAPFTLTPLAGDASFRRYFRVHQNEQTWVAMDAPPPLENIVPFITIATLLQKNQIHAPRILHYHLEQGFILLSDLGDQLFLSILNEQTVEHLYGHAFTTLHRLWHCEWDNLPLFDEGMILRELSLFVEWFLIKHLGLTLPSSTQHLLQKTFRQLIQSAKEQPQVFAHRDFHSRNLLWIDPPQTVGVIDFQDAVRGPLTYDLISLVRDCYLAWPTPQVDRWILQFQQEALARGHLHETSTERFLRWADWMGIQRHCKAIGIFSRLKHRDNKTQYLQDIPRTLRYICEVSRRHPELTDFVTWLEDTVLEKVT